MDSRNPENALEQVASKKADCAAPEFLECNKPVYENLKNDKLLSKDVGGFNQNNNENFNSLQIMRTSINGAENMPKTH